MKTASVMLQCFSWQGEAGRVGTVKRGGRPEAALCGGLTGRSGGCLLPASGVAEEAESADD
jgi:hypothetical protein